MVRVVKWSWFVSCVSIAFSALSTAASEKERGLTEYTTITIEPGRVLSQSQHQVSEIRWADIQSIYPFGTASANRFSQARWVLGSDGTALVSFIPGNFGNQPASLVGSWRLVEGGMRLHLVGQGERGLAFALDGLLAPDLEGLRFKAIYTVEVQGTQHVEWIEARLAQVKNQNDPERVVQLLEWARRERALDAEDHGTDHVFSEPKELLGGLPVPANYDVRFSGQVDGHAFDFQQGILILSSPGRPYTRTPDLLLATQGDVGPGWGYWTTSRSAAEAGTPGTLALTDTQSVMESSMLSPIAEPGVTAKASEGHLIVSIAPAPAPRKIGWWTRNPEPPGENTFVLVDTGILDLQVNDNQVFGSLSARGRLETSGRQESQLSAQISGRLQAGDFMKAVTSTVGARRFSGRWQEPGLGVMDLKQQNQVVTGIFDRGTVSGEADGPLLTFRLQSAPGGADQGFLRAARDGSLVGLAWRGVDAFATAQPIIAIQQGPSDKPTDGADKFPDPRTDEEANALKFLGYDFAAAGKHRDASEVLAKALHYYAGHANAAKTPGDQEYYLLAQGLAVHMLIESAFEAGDYRRLVDGLNKALDLQGSLGQDRAAPRLFRDQAEHHGQSLRKMADTLGLRTDAFEHGRGNLTAGGIGVGIDTAPGGKGLTISAIVPGMPSGQAGLVVGDLLLAIDGVATHGMTLAEASKRLRGTVGSRVSVTVSRSDDRRTLELTRAALTRVAPERRAGLFQVLTDLRDLSASIRQQVTADADRVAAAAEQPVIPDAFDDLAKDILDLGAELKKARAQTAALARQALSARPEALDIFERFVVLIDVLKKNPNDQEVTAHIMELDREEDEFVRINGGNDVDSSLLQSTMALDGTLSTLQRELTGRTRGLEMARQMADEAPRSEAIQQTLDALSQRLDRWRARLATDQGKIEALDEGQSFYQGYVKLLVRLNLPAGALAASESARARAFLDQLTTYRKTESQKTDLTGVLDTSAIAAQDKSSVRTPKVDEIMSLVQETQTTVVEYFILDDALLTWVINPAVDSNQGQPVVHLRSSPVRRKDLNAAVDRLKQLMVGLTPKDELAAGPKVSASLRELYGMLIKPVADLLPNKPDHPLTIVPHQSLFAVPFAALARPDAAGHDRYLIQDHALAFAPSLGVLKEIQGRAHDKEQRRVPTLLTVVNPQFPSYLSDETGANFAPLPQMEAEMGNIVNFYAPQGVLFLKGREATPEQVLAAAPSRDVILFATHAEAFPNPADSYIALAGRSLRISDLSKGRLDARLVILAACETGVGRISSDGVEGLGRAVLEIGADALIATLWKVSDQATMDFLFQFHLAWLRDGKGMTESLREAQLWLLTNYGEQIRLWAGFEIIGGEK